MVTPVDSESFPAVAVGSTVLELRAESLNVNKVLIAVLVLNGRLSITRSLWFADRSPPYIAQEPQYHRICHIGTRSSSGSEDPETECEVLNQDISLVDLSNAEVDGYIRNVLVCSSRNRLHTPSTRTHTSEVMKSDLGVTYSRRTRQVSCHLRQVVDCVGCKLPVVLGRIRTQHVILEGIRM